MTQAGSDQSAIPSLGLSRNPIIGRLLDLGRVELFERDIRVPLPMAVRTPFSG